MGFKRGSAEQMSAMRDKEFYARPIDEANSDPPIYDAVSFNVPDYSGIMDDEQDQPRSNVEFYFGADGNL
jgi:hypothetical protein